jgi:hypothetical protein
MSGCSSITDSEEEEGVFTVRSERTNEICVLDFGDECLSLKSARQPLFVSLFTIPHQRRAFERRVSI